MVDLSKPRDFGVFTSKNGHVFQTTPPNFCTTRVSWYSSIPRSSSSHDVHDDKPGRQHRRGGFGMFLKNENAGVFGLEKKKGWQKHAMSHSTLPKTNMVHLKMMVSQSRNLLFQVYHFQVNHVKLSEGNPWVFNFRKKGAFF